MQRYHLRYAGSERKGIYFHGAIITIKWKKTGDKWGKSRRFTMEGMSIIIELLKLRVSVMDRKKRDIVHE
jgi:hypothetical protein